MCFVLYVVVWYSSILPTTNYGYFTNSAILFQEYNQKKMQTASSNQKRGQYLSHSHSSSNKYPSSNIQAQTI